MTEQGTSNAFRGVVTQITATLRLPFDIAQGKSLRVVWSARLA